MHKDHQKNILYIKSLVDGQPSAKRISIYRWLADIAGDEWTTKQLNALADDMERIESRSDMFNAEFPIKGDGH